MMRKLFTVLSLTLAMSAVGFFSKAYALEAGYKPGGFFIKSEDGNYSIKIGGQAQFRFDYDINDGDENDIGFEIKRFRLKLGGNLFNKNFTYKAQIAWEKFDDELLYDALINYKVLGNNFEVRLGQQKVPWIRQQIISSSAQMFVDRSLASGEFLVQRPHGSIDDFKLKGNVRDIGIVLHGAPFDKKLEYSAAIFNGEGPNNVNTNGNFLYNFRLVYNVLGNAGYGLESDYDQSESPSLFLGATFNYNTQNITENNIIQLGGEAGLKYRGFSTTGEFFYRHTDTSDDMLDSFTDYGYYVQAGYFVIPKRMEVAARASQVFLEGPDNDRGEFQLGLSGYIYDTRLRVHSDYSYLPTSTPNGTINDHRLRLLLIYRL